MSTYTFSIQDDFPNHKVDSGRLTLEIRESSITTALNSVSTSGDDCAIDFKAELGAGDLATLHLLVAAHEGEPLPSDVQTVKVDAMTTLDGRLTVRQTTANSGTYYRLRCITFYTADPSKLHNKAIDGTDLGDVTIKCFDADGDEITSAPYTDAVLTRMDFEPHWDYEVIGGSVDIPDSIKEGTTDEWYASCLAVPDVPEVAGGSIPYVNQCNLEAITTPELDLDGRATTRMAYNEIYHTNKLRFEFKHPAGASQRFQVYLELFR